MGDLKIGRLEDLKIGRFEDWEIGRFEDLEIWSQLRVKKDLVAGHF